VPLLNAAKPLRTQRSNIDAFVSHSIGTAINSRHPRRREMAKKSYAKLHKGKKLEEQKPLKSAHGGFSITKPVDSSTPK
jgi:hypothetical protein